MVGYGTSLRRSRRRGWEAAYLDYESLKLLLTHIEAVYEEGGHRWVGSCASAGAISPVPFDVGDNGDGGGNDEETDRKKRSARDGGGGGGGGGGDYRDEIFLESDPDRAFASGSSSVDGAGSGSGSDSDSDDVSSLDGGGDRRDGGRRVGIEYAAVGVGLGGGVLPADANFSFSYSNEVGDELMGDYTMQRTSRGRGRDHTMVFSGGDVNSAFTSDAGFGNIGTVTFADEHGQEVMYSSANAKSSLIDPETERTGLLQNTNAAASKRAVGEPYHGISFQNFLGGPTDRGSGVGTADGFIFRDGQNERVFWRQALPSGHKKSKKKNGCLAGSKTRRKRSREKRKRKRRARVPAHLRNAHSKARAITERFLGLLKAEVEKVALFAHSRMGELAETIGSLRFSAESGYGDSSGQNRYDHLLSDGGMHPSASSSSEEGMRGRSFSWSSSDDEAQESKAPILSGSRQGDGSRGSLSLSASASASASVSSSSAAMDRRRAVSIDASGRRRRGSRGSRRNDDPARRQIGQSERLRIARPIFQRSDQVVGEDFLLLSAVDEADAYTAVGVELVHLLRFICVNTIAVRKICKKHDRLAKNRMLGGYYHRLGLQRKRFTRRARSKRKERRRHNKRNGMDNVVIDAQPLLGRVLSRALFSEDGSGIHDRLVGMMDMKIQNLANSSTIQMISSSLALALSEYEVTQCRADALARLNSTPKRRGYASPNDSIGSNEGGIIESLCYRFPQPKTFGVSPSYTKDSLIKKTQSNSGKNDALLHEGDAMSTNSDVSLMRLKYVVTSVFALREAARVKRNFFKEFLARGAMTFTGPNVAGDGLDGCSRETLDFLAKYNPDSALLLDSSTMHKCLQMDKAGPSMYSIMTASLAAALADLSAPRSHSEAGVHDEIISHAVTIIPRISGFDPFLGGDFTDTGKWRKRMIADGDNIVQRSTLRLNFTSIFLYSVNYYIISPSARPYALLLGTRPAHSATLIGIASLSSFVSALLHSHILQRNNKHSSRNGPAFFRLPLLASAFIALVGNIIYGRAHWYSSMAMALFGRFLVGFGSAEVLNRHLISEFVPAAGLVTETARLVRASMIGTFVGPLLGTVFSIGESDFASNGTVVVYSGFASAPGYFMASLWLLHILCLLCFFQETDHCRQGRTVDESATEKDKIFSDDSPLCTAEKQTDDYNSDTSVSDSGVGTPEPPVIKGFLYQFSLDAAKEALKRTFEAASSSVQTTQETANSDIRRKHKHEKHKKRVAPIAEKFHKKRSTTARLRRIKRLVLCNVALPVTIAVFALSKFAHEVIFSSCSLITRRYFGWYASLSGVPLIVFGALILPMNYFIESLSRYRGERKVMKLGLLATGLGILVLINYEALVVLLINLRDILREDSSAKERPPSYYDWSIGIIQFLSGSTIIIASSITLEGVSLSLMSKVAPAKLSGMFLDCGLIVALVGSFSKLAGDMLLLVVGLSHRIINTDMINSLSFCLVCACFAGYYIVRKHFFFLSGP